MTTVCRADEFLDCVARSGLVDAQVLDALQATAPPTAAACAQEFVAQNLITRFQADVLLQGKYRGFFVGKYKILSLLGAGGMGRVYLCEHTGMGHRVAMKVLPPDAEKSPSTVARFLREARAAARLNHPNIVRAYDLDRANGHHFIIMDYVEGLTLELVAKKFAPLDIFRAANYASQAASGLAHIAAAGLTHRDIKPANLILDATGLVRILDLGLASFHDEATHGLTQEANKHSILGTADYIAPEQALAAGDADIRSDLYSLGGSLYFLLTGRPPFSDMSLAQKIACHQAKTPMPITQWRPDVPPGLAAVVDRLLAKRPEDRYPSPGEVVVALREWAEPMPAPLPLSGDAGAAQRTVANMAISTAYDRPKVVVPEAPPSLSTRVTPLAPASSGYRPVAPGQSGPPAEPVSGRHYRVPPAEVLAEAIRAAKAGQRDQARQLLTEVTTQLPDSETAWFWLASVSDSPRMAAACLERVLHLNPHNAQAQKQLARLDATTTHCPVCRASFEGEVVDCGRCQTRLRLSPVGDYLTRPAPDRVMLTKALDRLSTQPPTADVFTQRGVIALNRRQPRQALKEFHQALAVEPTLQELRAYAVELEAYLARHPEAGRVVLVVDDNATARKLTTHALARAGYAVCEAPSSDTALELIRQETIPDMVLVNERVPQIDGVEFCRKLKSAPQTASLPAIFVGGGGYFEKARARRAGARDYLVKPVRPELLLEKLATALKPG